MELKQSFLLELRDQDICGTHTILPIGITGSSLYGATNDPSFQNYGIQVFTELLTILPFRITGSTHLWNSDNPSYWNYGINTSMELKQSMILPFEITGFRYLRSY